jgi:pyridinium-3,5-bisthiocarboxylic acid mononucleotide nickel chelatase
VLHNGAVTRLAWFHCFSGITGDTALAALIDAGADIDAVEDMMRQLPVRGWDLSMEPTQRAGLGGNSILVHTVDDSAVVRTYSHIVGLVEEARFPERVRQRALQVFAALAEADAHLRRVEHQQIHFHEICDLASILYIVGTCAALEVLNIEEIESSPVAQGMGLVKTETGYAPTPSPATLALLAARNAPTYGRDIDHELTNPIGAAILSALAVRFGPIPNMTPDSIGYGAAEKSLDGMPHVVQVVVGDRVPADRRGRRLVVVETNVDDATGEILAHTMSQIMEAGAIDCWITPAIGRYGRPMHTISALSDIAMAEHLGAIMMAETGSLGIRSSSVDRWTADRTFVEVDVDGFPIRIKVGPGRAKAEFDDAVLVAKKTNVPVREVIAKAETAFRRASEVRLLHPAHRPQDE